MKLQFIAAVFAALGAAATAEPDLARGEKEFGRCLACHQVADGDTVLRKGGRTGPNLFGIMGKPAASQDYLYADGLKAAAAKGLVWDEESLTAFLLNPTEFLRSFTGESVRTKMTFKMKDGEHIAAYLASLSQ